MISEESSYFFPDERLDLIIWDPWGTLSEVHSNFKNKWLSNYHNLEEEREAKRHGVGVHTVKSWRCTIQTETKYSYLSRESL